MLMEEMQKRLLHLEGESKKQSAYIEKLETELTQLKQTVDSFQAWTQEGKAHGGSGCKAWFLRVFPCCFSLKLRSSKSKSDVSKKKSKSFVQLKEETDGTSIRTGGSV